MYLSFSSIGLSFIAKVKYHKGFSGNYFEPPEPGELEIETLTMASTMADASFLLDSTVIDQLYEDAYEALSDALIEEAVDAAERKHDEQREELMCRSC